MKSRVEKLYDYHNVDLSEYRIHFKPDEQKIQEEFQHIAGKRAVWRDTDTIISGGMAVVSCVSDYGRYNKKQLKIPVGSGVFDVEFEQQIIGMHVGDSAQIRTGKGEAGVTVLKCMARDIPDVTDDLVLEYGPEGIDTVELLREHLIEEQKKEAISEVSYYVDQKILHQVFDNSEYVIYRDDFIRCMELQMNRFEVLAETEGMNLKTMSKEDFEGRIPVSSYAELKVMMYEETWFYLQEYLAGVYLAQEGQVDISEAAYEKAQQEYADYWHTTIEEAKRINTYDEFVVNQYQGYFYRQIAAYRDRELLKEG